MSPIESSTNLMNLLPSIRIIYHPYPIRKSRISSVIRVYNTLRSIWITDFLGAIGMVIFDLFVGEVVGLPAVLVGYLCCLEYEQNNSKLMQRKSIVI